MRSKLINKRDTLANSAEERSERIRRCADASRMAAAEVWEKEVVVGSGGGGGGEGRWGRETKTSQCWCCWASSEENRARSFVVGEEAPGLHGCEH